MGGACICAHTAKHTGNGKGHSHPGWTRSVVQQLLVWATIELPRKLYLNVSDFRMRKTSALQLSNTTRECTTYRDYPFGLGLFSMPCLTAVVDIERGWGGVCAQGNYKSLQKMVDAVKKVVISSSLSLIIQRLHTHAPTNPNTRSTRFRIHFEVPT